MNEQNGNLNTDFSNQNQNDVIGVNSSSINNSEVQNNAGQEVFSSSNSVPPVVPMQQEPISNVPVQDVISPTINQQNASIVDPMQQQIQQNIVNQDGNVGGTNQQTQDFSGGNSVVPTVQNGGIIPPSNSINNPVENGNVGFVQNGQPLRKKKNPIVVTLIFLVILAIIGLISYFVIYPFIIFNFFSSPKYIYDRTIDAIAEDIKYETNNFIKDKNIIEANLSFDTDIPSLYNFKGYTYTGRFGYDPKEDLFEVGYNIKDSSKNDIGQSYYLKNNSIYTRFTTYRDLIYINNNSDIEELVDNFKDMLNIKSEINNEELTYMIEAFERELKNSIDETKLSKENASITINDDTLKVLKFKYELNKDDMNNSWDLIRKNLAKDDKFVEIISKLCNTDKDNAIKNILGEFYNYKLENGFEGNIHSDFKNLDLDDNFKLIINIYTYGNKLDFVGISLDSIDNQHMHFYNKNGSFDFVYKNNDSNYVINGVKNSGKTDVVVKYNDEKIIDLVLNKFNKTEMDIDYSVGLSKDSEDDVFTGKFTFNRNITNENAKYNTSLKINMPDKSYVAFVLDVSSDWTNDVANINTSAAAQLSDYEYNNVLNTFNTELMKTPIGMFYLTASGMYSSSINDYYNSSSFYDFDYFNS